MNSLRSQHHVTSPYDSIPVQDTTTKMHARPSWQLKKFDTGGYSPRRQDPPVDAEGRPRGLAHQKAGDFRQCPCLCATRQGIVTSEQAATGSIALGALSGDRATSLEPGAACCARGKVPPGDCKAPQLNLNTSSEVDWRERAHRGSTAAWRPYHVRW